MRIIKILLVLLVAIILVSIIAIYRYNSREKAWLRSVEKAQPVYRPDTATVLSIVGTVHWPTENFTSDSLFEIINQFAPDIILTESDTAIFNNILHGYERKTVPLFAKIGRGLGFGKSIEENETRAVTKYRYQHPEVIIAPFDYEGRNEYHTKHNILNGPDTVMQAIDSLFKKKSLSPSHEAIWKNWNAINDTLDPFYQQTPAVINRESLYALTARRQRLQYDSINRIVQEDQRLAQYRAFYQTNTDFWKGRNDAMVSHIEYFINKYPGEHHRAYGFYALLLFARKAESSC